MKIHVGKFQSKRGEKYIFIILRAKSTLNLGSQRVSLRVNVVKGG